MALRRLTIWTAALLVTGSALSCAPERPSDQKNVRTDRAQQTTEADEEAVAIVNGEVITAGELERRLEGLAPYARARYTTTDRKKEYLRNVVAFEILADEAERREFGDDPEVVQAMKEVMVRRMLRQIVRERVKLRDISDAEIEAYYQEHIDRYRKPLARRAALIEVDTEAEARRIREDLIERGSSQDAEPLQAFRIAASRYSIDPKARRAGGDVGFVNAGDAQDVERPALAEQVFALDAAGEVSPAFRLGERWALATFIEERQSREQPLDEVRRTIQETLLEKKRQEVRQAFIDELRAKARVEIYDDALQAVATPPEMPPQRLEDVPLIPIRDLKGRRGVDNATADDGPQQEDTPHE